MRFSTPSIRTGARASKWVGATFEVPNWLGNLLLWVDLGVQALFLLGFVVIPGSKTANRFGQPATQP